MMPVNMEFLKTVSKRVKVGSSGGYYRVVISSNQCRASRALLGITQAELSRRSGVSIPVIKRFEKGSDPRASTVNAIEKALVEAGVTLIEDGSASPADGGEGVRMRRRQQ